MKEQKEPNVVQNIKRYLKKLHISTDKTEE